MQEPEEAEEKTTHKKSIPYVNDMLLALLTRQQEYGKRNWLL